MKAIVVIVLMITAAFGRAQEFSLFIPGNEASARRLADSITANAKRHFEFQEVRRTKLDTSAYVLKYRDVSDSTGKSVMNVVFEVQWIGANRDLEIPGTRRIVFVKVEGLFPDLFPAWKKFVNAMANINDVASAGRDEVMAAMPDETQAHFYFKKNGDYWTIRIL